MGGRKHPVSELKRGRSLVKGDSGGGFADGGSINFDGNGSEEYGGFVGKLRRDIFLKGGDDGSDSSVGLELAAAKVGEVCYDGLGFF